MPILMVLFGLSILILVLTDVLVTTLTMGGGGPITGKLSSRLWRVALGVHKRGSNHRLLTIMGWVVAMGIPCLWMLFTWLGWTLLFSAYEEAVVNATTKVPAQIWERVYFTGYTLSTLGMGDYQPQGAVWQLATAIASANGFVLVTLEIAYLLPVISAVILKRQISLYIAALGGTPDEIILRAWNGTDFGQFDQHLIALTGMLTQMTESYLAYPILHYFHTVERSKAFVLSVVTLDDALTLLSYGVQEGQKPDRAALEPLRRASSAFLKTLRSAYIEPSSHNPPLPPLDRIRECGIPTKSDRQFWDDTKYVTHRRQLLLALVKHDGWTWDAVASSKSTNRGHSLDDETPIEEAILH